MHRGVGHVISDVILLLHMHCGNIDSAEFCDWKRNIHICVRKEEARTKMLAKNQTPDPYCNSLKMQNGPAGPLTRRIKQESCDMDYCGLAPGITKAWSHSAPRTNDYHGNNINRFRMFANETHAPSSLSQGETQMSNVPDTVPDTVHDTEFSDDKFSVLRAEREFVPTDRKDSLYWSKRIKNNDSARRSRMKRRNTEQDIMDKLRSLQKENIELKYELASLNRHFAKEKENNKMSASLNDEGTDRKYETVSPHLNFSDPCTISELQGTPQATPYGKEITDIPTGANQYYEDQITFPEKTVLRAETSSVKSQSRDHEHVSNDISNGYSRIPYGSTYPQTDQPAAESVAGFYSDSYGIGERQTANGNRQSEMSANEHASVPIIVNVFSLQNNSANPLDIKHGIQSVPHKYRHKRGFHSAFAMQ